MKGIILAASLAALMGGNAMGANGFKILEKNGAWWFAGPDNKPFLSLGVDCIGEGVPAAEFKPANPGYSPFLRPGDTFEKWRDRTAKRLKWWGFNTTGGWSDPRYSREAGVPHTPVLHIGVMLSAPWNDLWDPALPAQARELADKLVKPYRDDPAVLGYFLDNEFGWGDDYFLGIAWGWPAQSPGKRKLVETMKSLYGGDFSRFQVDFTTSATGWEGLGADVKTVRKPGHGHRAIDAWMYEVARKYYGVFAGAVRAAHPGALILGDRFRVYYPQAVARAARGILDVVSTNYDSGEPSGWISPAYFETLHSLSGLPVMVGEFYTTARQNRSGNMNSGGNFTLVDTQEIRASATIAQARNFARFPFMVGWHWFQYNDEPTYGRDDGEDCNMGLVDIYDEPYAVMAKAFGEANKAAPTLHKGEKPAAASGPLAVYRQDNLKSNGNLAEWDKSRPVPRALLKAPAPLEPFGDVFLAWDAGNLWLGIRAYDFTLSSGGATKRSDPTTWGEMHRLRVKAGPYNLSAATGMISEKEGDETGRTVVYAEGPASGGHSSAALSATVEKWHYVWEAAIPAAALGKKALKAGDRLKIAADIANRGDFERMALDTEVVLR